MKINKIIILLISTGLILINCARQTTPEGGPKDKTKPQLLEEQSIPKNNQKNFKGQKIELYFSEDVKLKDPKEEILITPSPGKDTKFSAVGNKVTITPQTPWKDTTTYNLLFRESIQDVTESNPTEEIHLAFSTGPTIDSLSIAGSVVESTTEKIPEKITVAIYSSDTFNIFNNTSTYLTKTDKEGNFKISNLKQGKYFIYAYDDKNKNLKVESTNEKYGFKSKELNLVKNIDSVRLSLVKMDSRIIKLNSNRSNIKTTTLRFNKSIINYTIENDPNETLNTFGDNQTEITFYYDETKPLKDSVQIKLQATDSLEQKFDSLVYIKQGEAKAIKTTYSVSIEPLILDYKTGILEAKGKTSIPTAKFTMDSIYIIVDTVNTIKINKQDIRYDVKTKKFNITSKLDTTLLNKRYKTEETTVNKIKNNLQTKKELKLTLGKGSLISIYNDSSKRQTIDLPIKQITSTGSLSITVNTKQKNYIVELLNSSNKVEQQIKNKTEYTFEKLAGGEYKIRIIIDKNNNGKWDAGNIYQREEPEEVNYYKGLEGKYNIPVRENWFVGPIKISF